MTIILIGNKADLERREVTFQEGTAAAAAAATCAAASAPFDAVGAPAVAATFLLLRHQHQGGCWLGLGFRV